MTSPTKTSRVYLVFEILSLVCISAASVILYSIAAYFFHHEINKLDTFPDPVLFTIFAIVGAFIAIGLGAYMRDLSNQYSKGKELDKVFNISKGLSICGMIGTSAYLIFSLVNDFKKHDFSNQKTLWLIGGGIVFCLFLFLSLYWRKQGIERTIEEQKPHKQISYCNLNNGKINIYSS